MAKITVSQLLKKIEQALKRSGLSADKVELSLCDTNYVPEKRDQEIYVEISDENEMEITLNHES